MKEQIIKLSEEKGFKSLHFDVELTNHTELIYYLWLCELQKWLRGKHNIHVEVNSWSNSDGFEYSGKYQNKHYCSWVVVTNSWETYEQALEPILIKGLKQIK